tara:strand:+ start:14490 stop:15314 length:825 start_codon:yes stop_codon:yes gene_type:complete
MYLNNQSFFFELVLVFILGCCIGSFINVIVYRFPRNQSILFPRSFCPECKYKIKWFDNIPIISWILLAGKCRKCNQKINYTYPLIEFFTGIVFLLCYLSNIFINTNNTSLLYIVASWSLATIALAISFIDIYHYWLPKSLNYLLIFLGIFIIILFFSDTSNLSFPYQSINNILSAFLGYVLFRLVAYISKLIYKREALGQGDALFVAGIGAWNGFSGLYFSLIISFVLAGTYVFIGLLTRRIDYGGYIPLGPFLASGLIIVWCIGKENILQFLI